MTTAMSDVESAASWRSYKNNRYATLGAQRILRVLRRHFREHKHILRREEDFERYAWELFEDLNNAGALAILHCGVAEENDRAAHEQENRRRRAKGLKPEATPDEREQQLREDKERLEQLERERRATAERLQALERAERRRAQRGDLKRRSSDRLDVAGLEQQRITDAAAAQL